MHDSTSETSDGFDAEQFAGYLITQGLADNSIRNYKALYQRWLDHCAAEDHDPMDLDPHMVRSWSNTIKLSRPMRDQARAVINHVAEMIDADKEVGYAVRVPKRPKRPTRALPDEKARTLLKTALGMGVKGSVVIVGLYTAARRSEIAAMEWEHVDFDAGEIRFYRTKVSDWHTVPLHPVLHDHLEARWLEGSQWLFPGRWGGHVSPATIWQYVIDVAEKAGIGHVTPHQLRHTALTMMNERTKDLRATQEVAGHSKPETTARYSHVRKQRMQEAIGSLNYLDDDGPGEGPQLEAVPDDGDQDERGAA